ncbi:MULTISPECIES: response regulator [unclassified Nocardioides]|uniref:response regulator n=1 Tax=unclassified Nocardioides TaxID=2615069 RepID=UPI003621BDA5
MATHMRPLVSFDVVIVDDAPETRRMLRTALRFRSRFRTVGEAATGMEAIALVERIKPHIIILDLGLPDVSGLGLVNRIRAASPHSKVVILTGSAADDPAWFADRLAAYVRKGQFDQLIETLESLTTPPPSAASHLSLPSDPASVALTREHVRRQTGNWSIPRLTDDAVAIVSELVTNAIEHGRPGFDLRLELRDRRVLRIEVGDHGIGTPEPQAPSLDAERGRGLFIVAALAVSWGILPSLGEGKIVWAELLDA